MDAKHKAKWERWRRLGKRRYVLLLTLLHVVGYLVLFPIVSVALFDEPLGMDSIVVALFAAMTVGPIMGLLAWHNSERAYQDSTSQKASRTD